MKKLIYILLLGIAVFIAKPVCAQSGVNNNSDFHVPVQVPTIPQATAVTVVTPVAVPELTITPIASVGAANLVPTVLEIPAMPPVPTPTVTPVAAPTAATTTTTTTTTTTAAAPAVAPTATAAVGGVNAPAATTTAAVTVTQPIPALPPVPPIATIPDLQLSL